MLDEPIWLQVGYHFVLQILVLASVVAALVVWSWRPIAAFIGMWASVEFLRIRYGNLRIVTRDEEKRVSRRALLLLLVGIAGIVIAIILGA